MPKVKEVNDIDDSLFVECLDSYGRTIVFNLETDDGLEGGEGYILERIYIPKEVSWNVKFFQEVVDVRSDMLDHFENFSDYDIQDGSFELKQVYKYDELPYLENESES